MRNERLGGGILEAMLRRPVAVNLLLVALVAVGGLLLVKSKREVFPHFELDRILVEVAVEGANASEIESGVLLAIDDAVLGLDGVKRVASEARRGMGVVAIDVYRSADLQRVLQDVKNAVDRVPTLPANAERPVVRVAAQPDRVFSLIVYGELPRVEIVREAERLRLELLAQDGISRVEHAMKLKREFQVEVDPWRLEALGMSGVDLAEAVGKAVVELNGGNLQGDWSEVAVSFDSNRYQVEDYSDIPLVSSAGGGIVRLGEVGSVSEGFGENRSAAFFNGAPAARLDVFRKGDERPEAIAATFREYLARADLPEGVRVQVVDDQTEAFEGRVRLMLDSAWMGLVLVVVMLGLFLEPRVAFWVMLGIPVSFVGAFIPITLLGGSINMFSLAAFIVSIGVVVDDAIIVGEGIYAKRRAGRSGYEAACEGLRELAGPVSVAVLTNVVVFLPLFFLPGFLGKILFHIPVVVVSVLLISLLESLFILPRHLLSASDASETGCSRWGSLSRKVNAGLQGFAERRFDRWLRAGLRWRYASLAGVAAFFLLSLGLLSSGWVKTAFTPQLDADVATALVKLPLGTPISEAERVGRLLEKAARRSMESRGMEADYEGVATQISDQAMGEEEGSDGRIGVEALVFLGGLGARSFGGERFAEVWAEHAKVLPGAEGALFSGVDDAGAEAIELEFAHPDFEVAKRAGEALESLLIGYEDIVAVDLGGVQGRRSFEVELLPSGEALGLSQRALSEAVRGAFYGVEALRFQDGLEEVRVKVRFPSGYRKTWEDLERMPISLSGGGSALLRDVARLKESETVGRLLRVDGRRVVPVSVQLSPRGDDDGVAELLEERLLPELEALYPGLEYAFAGEQREDEETLAALSLGLLLAALGVYALLAVSFNDYWVPLVVVAVIPLGITGAILGHLVMGVPFSLVSFVGVIALSGIVVNDALVLAHAALRMSRAGRAWFDALVLAAQSRLRPILLTSLTTFVGLLPMVLETSAQARFLAPLAISIGFGVLVATATTLLVVPCLLLAQGDLRGREAP
ncbi:efflux RND transporter permease subunit [Pelagicoccus sp. SDUM812005]|nr:efflux RND transporter permease subunit [Pelagicoccus sp. SDUM812005]